MKAPQNGITLRVYGKRAMRTWRPWAAVALDAPRRVLARIGAAPDALDVHGYDRVWYRGRTYVNPQPRALSDAETAHGTLIPTGDQVSGMPVLEPAGAGSPYASPVLILRKDQTSCIAYVLSGGP